MVRNHQIRTIANGLDTTKLTWDADGQLLQMRRYTWDAGGSPAGVGMVEAALLATRTHLWNENGQLSFFMDDRTAGYYGYDGNGERVYKLTGYVHSHDYNAGQDTTRAFFNDIVLYVNPYFIVTPKGYTKHYYNGSQRLASVVGDINALPDNIAGKASEYSDNKATDYVNSFTNTDSLLNVRADYLPNMLLPVLSKTKPQDSYVLADNTYYYHSDHLGSMSMITDGNAQLVEHRRYLPYGEEWYHYRSNVSTYVERFLFTGKERDAESGYDYFGARYYDSRLLTGWMSVDPMSDKYLNTSPYLYCAGNPMNAYDPNGMWSVKVSASSNRKDYPYAKFQVYSNSGKLIYQTVVKAQGTHRERTKTNGDTPMGKYAIIGWRKTGPTKDDRYDPVKYGKNDLLALDYQEGEAAGKRQDMHVHGGRNQEELWNTGGCFRIADEDIAEMKSVTDLLEASDPTEHGTTLELRDNLSAPISYKNDRESVKYDWTRDGGELPEIVVTPKKDSQIE